MARRFARRRKPRVLWLPVKGNDLATDPAVFFAPGDESSMVVPNTGAAVTQVNPVTFDYTDSPQAEEGSDFRSLQDLASGNNYRLRRIVGKVFCGASVENNALAGFPILDVAAGFMVNRTDDQGNMLIDPVTDPTTGPLAQDAMQDPWIWRRRWRLGVLPWQLLTQANLSSATVAAWTPAWPSTNIEYGSIQDGPHLDQKTARVISNQERLFFWIQARMVNPATNINNGIIDWTLDVRMVASLRTNQGNRRNASR